MVNEFIPLSSQKRDDDGCYYRESSEKQLASESSDEDTTSSSLIPIPDTLDVMRNELKNTINNFGTTDYVASPKPNDFILKNLDLDTKQPTERELSIAEKISSANLLLDDLLNTSHILPKNLKDKNPLVFAAKAIRQRSSPPASETSGPTTGSRTSSSENPCPSLPVPSFVYPQAICACSRCPTEVRDQMTEPIENNTKIAQDPKKADRRSFLLEKMKCVRLRCKKKKKPLVNESQQTQPNYPHPNALHGYMPEEVLSPPHRIHCRYQQQQFPMGMGFCFTDYRGQKDKCKCLDVSSEISPECICQTVASTFCECNNRKSTKDAKCGSDELSESPQKKGDNGENADSLPADQPMRMKIPLMPLSVRPKSGRERIDIYYFDHGNSSYYRTTDSHRARFTEFILERTDEYASKFWAEVFGTVTIAIAFVVSFVLQLYRCVFTAVIRALTVGLIQIFSDYFFKPLLTVLFNGLIQPCLILGYNIATSMKDFCIPVCEICEFCAKDLAIVFGSCRLVEVNQKACSSPSCHCRHNV